MEKREAVIILRELVTPKRMEPGEQWELKLEHTPDEYQEAVTIFEQTISELEKSRDYVESMKKQTADLTNRVRGAEALNDVLREKLEVQEKLPDNDPVSVYEEVFNRIFRSGEPFILQVGGQR